VPYYILSSVEKQNGGEIVEICVLLPLVISQSWNADCCHDSSGQLACVCQETILTTI